MVLDYLRIKGRHPPDSALGSGHRYWLSPARSKFIFSSHICPFGGFPGAGEGRKTFMRLVLADPSSQGMVAWPLGYTHLLQLLVLPVHEGLPVLKELAF